MDSSGDLFAETILPNCIPTSSQEEKLQSCRFAGELQVVREVSPSSPDTDEASEQATGIVMVSLPDSFDEYQTPPEQHSFSQNSSNDGQVPPARTEGNDGKIDGGGGGEGEAMVVDDESEHEALRAVDLTKDSENPEPLEKSPRVPVEEDDTVMVDVETDEVGVESRVNEMEDGIKVTETLEAELPNPPEENTHQPFVEMPLSEQDESISDENTPGPRNTIEVENPQTEQDESFITVGSMTPRKNIDDIDKFRYVNVGMKRKLPGLIKGQVEGTGEEDDYEEHEAFVELLDQAFKLLAGQVPGDGGSGGGGGGYGGDEDEDDFDFLETAKNRGLTFPQPRWWPLEGSED